VAEIRKLYDENNIVSKTVFHHIFKVMRVLKAFSFRNFCVMYGGGSFEQKSGGKNLYDYDLCDVRMTFFNYQNQQSLKFLTLTGSADYAPHFLT
jgi:hypothetical protein